MCCLEDFISVLQECITGKKPQEDNNIVRKHSRKLEQLGDISFPLNVKNWHHLLIPPKTEGYNSGKIIEDVDEFIARCKEWHMKISKCNIINDDFHIFFERASVYSCTIQNVLDQAERYGASDILQKDITVKIESALQKQEILQADLSTLRMYLLCDVANNLAKFCMKQNATEPLTIHLTLYNTKHDVNIICGPILNENNVKTSDSAQDLYLKRTTDMQLMAQHKYGLRLESNAKLKLFFENLGRAAVTIEMLSNKPHKSSKIILGDLRASNKGAAFIMYNCARLSALFREFEKKISVGKYPQLPAIADIRFTLLNQPEEWELMYVYILQFPLLIKSCIKDVEKGVFNPQYLITFLSNLSSIFSVYYRRVRILTDPRDHLFATIHARIYLLKALQCVLHNALRLLNIEPIKEM